MDSESEAAGVLALDALAAVASVFFLLLVGLPLEAQRSFPGSLASLCGLLLALGLFVGRSRFVGDR